MTVIYFLLACLSLAESNSPDIKPLRVETSEYSFKIKQPDCRIGYYCGMQVLLVSKNIKSKKVKWERELYEKAFDPGLPSDGQTVQPKTLTFDKKENQITITDERGSTYKVSTKGDLVSPLKSIIYPVK